MEFNSGDPTTTKKFAPLPRLSSSTALSTAEVAKITVIYRLSRIVRGKGEGGKGEKEGEDGGG